MRRVFLSAVLLSLLLVFAACGGDDEPTATPEPLPTATVEPTTAPEPTATLEPTAAPATAAVTETTAITESTAVTETDSVTASEGVTATTATTEVTATTPLTSSAAPTTTEAVTSTAPMTAAATTDSAQAPAEVVALFTKATCIACHTIPGIPASVGMVGPNLTGIGTTAATRVPGQTAEQYLHESIVNPNAFIAPQCPTGPCLPNVMLQNLADLLTPEEIDTVVAYLASLK